MRYLTSGMPITSVFSDAKRFGHVYLKGV